MTVRSTGSPAPPRPTFLRDAPVCLRFGTSGLRGLVREMTDLEIVVNTRGFLASLADRGTLRPGDRVALAEDLRATDPSTGLASSPRIGLAVAQAIRDAELVPVHCGRIPTPALAHWAMSQAPALGKRPMPSVMVTGSHIPADRNGVKFYRADGEVLKADEPAILAAVERARADEYGKGATDTRFDAEGMWRRRPAGVRFDPTAERAYVARYLAPFHGQQPLAGMRLVLYEHSAVGRDLLAEILLELGAELERVGRSSEFVAVDTEDVSPAEEARLRAMMAGSGAAALVSTDGDSDRPLLLDETGRFRRGDTLGIVAAELLGARFAAVPISSTDAIDRRVSEQARRAAAPPMTLEKTRIGSPYVIEAMQRAAASGLREVVGWEANGGFLTAGELPFGRGTLGPLPTRDAVLPLLCALLASRRRSVPVSQLFEELPARATRAGLVDGFPVEASRALLARLRPADDAVVELGLGPGQWTVLRRGAGSPDVLRSEELAEARELAGRLTALFSAARGFGPIARVSVLDGLRVTFADGDVAHVRPSGNAPQLRLYAVSDSQQRADEIVARGVREPDGWLWQLLREAQ